jgi:hypothetical protein
MKALVDNDILIKGACYGLLLTLVADAAGGGCGVLGASRFVVPNNIRKKELCGDRNVAQAQFADFLAGNEVIEPSAVEQEMAGKFEATAQKMALNLDTGESQLLAVLVMRRLSWLFTGDKRAIVSIESLLDSDASLAVIAAKIKCFEQLLREMVTLNNVDEVRAAICAEPAVDRTLNICFGCKSPEISFTTVSAGLSSYIADLRTKAVRVLAT